MLPQPTTKWTGCKATGSLLWKWGILQVTPTQYSPWSFHWCWWHKYLSFVAAVSIGPDESKFCLSENWGTNPFFLQTHVEELPLSLRGHRIVVSDSQDELLMNQLHSWYLWQLFFEYDWFFFKYIWWMCRKHETVKTQRFPLKTQLDNAQISTLVFNLGLVRHAKRCSDRLSQV